MEFAEMKTQQQFNEWVTATYPNVSPATAWQHQQTRIDEMEARATKYAFENDVMALRLGATENKLAIAVEALKQATTLIDIAMTDKDGNKFVYLPTRRGSMISALDTLDVCNEALKLIEARE